MSVIATLNIGANGATSKLGKSQPISSSVDRREFLRLHRSAHTYVLGRNSFSAEKYSESGKAILVLSRDKTPISGATLITTDDLSTTMQDIAAHYSHPILVESGVNLLLPLIDAATIEELHLSISPIDGDGHYIDYKVLVRHFDIESDVTIEGTRLLKCRYKGDTAYSKGNA